MHAHKHKHLRTFYKTFFSRQTDPYSVNTACVHPQAMFKLTVYSSLKREAPNISHLTLFLTRLSGVETVPAAV